ncbi:hypothetical protein YYE_01123 [Plasmodium vinckei vinckei]|nr:hypothetical protein YYE_01123 [Plasmodium vinckei vinckei]
MENIDKNNLRKIEEGKNLDTDKNPNNAYSLYNKNFENLKTNQNKKNNLIINIPNANDINNNINNKLSNNNNNSEMKYVTNPDLSNAYNNIEMINNKEGELKYNRNDTLYNYVNREISVENIDTLENLHISNDIYLRKYTDIKDTNILRNYNNLLSKESLEKYNINYIFDNNNGNSNTITDSNSSNNNLNFNDNNNNSERKINYYRAENFPNIPKNIVYRDINNDCMLHNEINYEQLNELCYENNSNNIENNNSIKNSEGKDNTNLPNSLNSILPDIKQKKNLDFTHLSYYNNLNENKGENLKYPHIDSYNIKDMHDDKMNDCILNVNRTDDNFNTNNNIKNNDIEDYDVNMKLENGINAINNIKQMKKYDSNEQINNINNNNNDNKSENNKLNDDKNFQHDALKPDYLNYMENKMDLKNLNNGNYFNIDYYNQTGLYNNSMENITQDEFSEKINNITQLHDMNHANNGMRLNIGNLIHNNNDEEGNGIKDENFNDKINIQENYNKYANYVYKTCYNLIDNKILNSELYYSNPNDIKNISLIAKDGNIMYKDKMNAVSNINVIPNNTDQLKNLNGINVNNKYSENEINMGINNYNNDEDNSTINHNNSDGNSSTTVAISSAMDSDNAKENNMNIEYSNLNNGKNEIIDDENICNINNGQNKIYPLSINLNNIHYIEANSNMPEYDPNNKLYNYSQFYKKNYIYNEIKENNEHIQGSEMRADYISKNGNTENKGNDSTNNSNTYADEYDTEIEEMILKKNEFKKMILNNESEFTTINEDDELYKTVLYFEKKNKKILKMRKTLRRKRKLKKLENAENDDDNINGSAKIIQENIPNDKIPKRANNLMPINNEYIPNEGLNGISMNYNQHEKGYDFSHISKNNNGNGLLSSCLGNVDDKNIANENLKEDSFSNFNINNDIGLPIYGIKREHTFSISGVNFQNNINDVGDCTNTNDVYLSNQLNGTDNQMVRIKSEETLKNGETETTELNTGKKKPGRRKTREKKTKDNNDGNLIYDNQVDNKQVDGAINEESNEPKNGSVRKRRSPKNKNKNNIISNGLGIDLVENNNLNFETNNEINLQANNNNNEVILNADYNNDTLNNHIHVKHELTNEHLNENNLISCSMLAYNGNNTNNPELDQGLSNNMTTIEPYGNNMLISDDANMPTKRKNSITKLNSTNQGTGNTPKRTTKREPKNSPKKNSNKDDNITQGDMVMVKTCPIRIDEIKTEILTSEDELKNRNNNDENVDLITKNEKKKRNVNIFKMKKEKSEKSGEKKVKIKIPFEEYYKKCKEIYNNIDTLAKIDDANIPSIEDENFIGNLTDLLEKKENLICSNCLYAYKIQIAPKKNEKNDESNELNELNKVSCDKCSEQKDENIDKLASNTNDSTNDDKIENADNNDEKDNKTLNESSKNGNYIDINTFNEILDKNMAQENEYKITFYCLCGYSKYINDGNEWKQVINCYYDEKNELKPKAPYLFCTKCKEMLITNRFLDKDKTKIIMVCECGSRNYDRTNSFWSRRGNIKQRKAPQILCEECNSKMWVHTWLDDIGSKVKLLCKCGFKNFLKKNNNWVRSPRWKKPVPLIICNSCQQKMYMSQWLSNDGTKVKMKCECGWKTLIKEGNTWVRSEWSKKLLCLRLVKNPDLLQKKYQVHSKKKNKLQDGNELLYIDENNNIKQCNNEMNPSLACDPMIKNNQDVFVTSLSNCINGINNSDNNNSPMLDNHALSYSHNDIINIRTSGSIIGSEINNSNNIFQQNGQFLNNVVINHGIDIINNDSGFQGEIKENHKQKNMTLNNPYDNIILESSQNNSSSSHINKDANAGYNSIQNSVNNYLNCKTNYSNNSNNDGVFLEPNQDYYLSNNKDETNIVLNKSNTTVKNKKKNMGLNEKCKTNESKKTNNKRKASNNNDNNKYWENGNLDMIISNDNNTKKNQGALLYKQNFKKKKNMGPKGKNNNPENILIGSSVPLDSTGSTIISNSVVRECSLIYDENASNIQRYKSQQSNNSDNINNREDILKQRNDHSYGFYNIERPIDENSLNNNFNKIYCDNTNVNTINNNGTKDSNDNHRDNGENNNSNSNTSGNNNDTNDNNSNKNSGNSNPSTCYYVNNYYDHQNYDKSYFNHPYVISHFNENTFNNNNDINSNNTHDAYNNILNTTYNHANNNFDMNYNPNLPTHHIDDKKKYLLEHIEKLNFNLSENNINNYLENNLIENVNDQKNDNKNKKEKKKKKMDPNDINVNYQNDVAQTNMSTNELYNESGGIMKYVKNITNIFSSNKDKNDTNVDNQNDNTTNNNKKKNKGRNANKKENASKNENKGNGENDKTSSTSIVNENLLVDSESCKDGNIYLKKNNVNHNKNDFKDYFPFSSSHNENPQFIENEYCNESTNIYNNILNLQAINEKLKNENPSTFKSQIPDVAQEKNNMNEIFCNYNFSSDSEEKQCAHEIKYKINDFLTICTNCHEYINNNMDCNKMISSNVLPESSNNSICKMNIHENDSEYKNMNNYDHIIKNKKNMNSYHNEHIYNSLKMDNNYSMNFLDHQNICDTNYLGNNNCKNSNRNTTISNNNRASNNNTKNCINDDSKNTSQCYSSPENDATTPTNGKSNNDNIHIIENVDEFNHLYNQYCEYYLNNGTIDDNQIKSDYITNLFFQYQNSYAQNSDKCINSQTPPLESDKLYFSEENKYISDSTQYMNEEINSNEKIGYDEKNSNNNNSDDNYQDNYENYIKTECNTNVCYNIIHT